MALGQTAGCPGVNRAKKFMCSPRNTGNINFSLWLTGGLSQGCADFQKVYVFKVYVPFSCSCDVFPCFKGISSGFGVLEPRIHHCSFRARIWALQAPKTLRFKGKMANFETQNAIKQGKNAKRTNGTHFTWGSICWPFLRSAARAPTIKAVRGTVAITGVFDN